MKGHGTILSSIAVYYFYTVHRSSNSLAKAIVFAYMLLNYKVSNFIALQIHGHIKVYHIVASSSHDRHNGRNQDLHNSTHNHNCHNWHRYHQSLSKYPAASLASWSAISFLKSPVWPRMCVYKNEYFMELACHNSVQCLEWRVSSLTPV